MNEHLRYLIEIAAKDREIASLEPEIESIENAFVKKQREYDLYKYLIDDLHDMVKKIKVNISNHELVIKEQSIKLKDNERKEKDVKNERELKALETERSLMGEKVNYLNSEIANLESEKESKMKEIELAQIKFKALKKDLENTKKQVDAKTLSIREELKIVFAEKDVLIHKMDESVIRFYEQIYKWAKNTSVVHVRKQSCSGCNMRISNKLFEDIKRGEEIITCPHCGRILYIDYEIYEKELQEKLLETR